MNTINFIQTGGVPFTNDVAQEFENAYKIFNAYGALAGDKTIISGCVENGNSVSAGFLYVNNELFYFEGGAKSDNIFLNVENIDKVFEDQTTKTLIKIRTLKFGNAIENVWAWSDFKRIDTMLSLMARLDTLEAAQTITNAKLAIFTQGGVVFPWFKSVDDIPEGFAPVWDIAGKTIVGLDPNDTDFDTVGKVFGFKTHTLKIEELPSHRFKLAVPSPTNPQPKNPPPLSALNSMNTISNYGNDGNYVLGGTTGEPTVGQSSEVGGDLEHNNVQPSIVAHYIEWVGLD
jgi:microcystin-dependent protein